MKCEASFCVYISGSLALTPLLQTLNIYLEEEPSNSNDYYGRYDHLKLIHFKGMSCSARFTFQGHVVFSEV